jgi:hypothetical protein
LDFVANNRKLAVIAAVSALFERTEFRQQGDFHGVSILYLISGIHTIQRIIERIFLFTSIDVARHFSPVAQRIHKSECHIRDSLFIIILFSYSPFSIFIGVLCEEP